MEKHYNYEQTVEGRLANESTPAEALANRVLRICLDSWDAHQCKQFGEVEVPYLYARLKLKEELIKIFEEKTD